MRDPKVLGAEISLCALALVLAGESARGGRQYRRPDAGIALFEIPRGWEARPASQIAYPNLLLIADGPDGSRLVLGSQRIAPGTTALHLAAEARGALPRQGFREPRITPLDPGASGEDRCRLDSSRDGGRKTMRQVYVTIRSVGIVVTVISPTGRQARAFRDLESATGSLVPVLFLEEAPDAGVP